MEFRSGKVGVQGVMLPSVLMISLAMVLMGCVVRQASFISKKSRSFFEGVRTGGGVWPSGELSERKSS
jgi:hypothetical protein